MVNLTSGKYGVINPRSPSKSTPNIQIPSLALRKLGVIPRALIRYVVPEGKTVPSISYRI